MDNKTLFVAGATGLAGTSVIKHVLAQYPKTRIKASFYKHTKPFIRDKRIAYVYGDLRSEKQCRQICKGCDCAIMVAANSVGAGAATVYSWEQMYDNVIMNIQMFQAFYREHINRVVFVGSATVYQEYIGHIKEEQLDLNHAPHQNYFGVGWAFRFIEKVCQFWNMHSGMEIVVARVSNIFGPYAKFNPKTSNFIPAIIRKAVDKMDPFEVWGSPGVTRDVVYSEDFARAIALMMNDDLIKHETFNIGSGVKTTVREVVTLALKHAGHIPKKIKYNSREPSTIPFRALDCAKAKSILQWQPQYSVDEGISMTTQWWIENKRRWKK
ncbi:MAG: NAD(P)-dependent oxidoreductase [Candidatus Omnitrophota bacterium]|nr:NAD(P)-dependent oxidoreductase [Candidatus Omnitrophota bacterium]